MRNAILFLSVFFISFGLKAQTEKEQKNFATQFFNDLRTKQFDKIETYFVDSLMTNRIIELIQEEGTDELKTYGAKQMHNERRKAQGFFMRAVKSKYASLKKNGVQWSTVKLDSVSIKEHQKKGTITAYTMNMHFGYRSIGLGLVFYDIERRRFFCFDSKIKEQNNDPRLKIVEKRNEIILSEDIAISDDTKIKIPDVEVEMDIPELMPQREVFQIVEEMPEFPGGESKMYEFILKNIKYPEMARENKIKGRVYVQFVVSKDGSLNKIKVLRGIGGGCDEEAVRIVKRMPKWKPGKQNGKTVPVQFTLPFNFKLQ